MQLALCLIVRMIFILHEWKTTCHPISKYIGYYSDCISFFLQSIVNTFSQHFNPIFWHKHSHNSYQTTNDNKGDLKTDHHHMTWRYSSTLSVLVASATRDEIGVKILSAFTLQIYIFNMYQIFNHRITAALCAIRLQHHHITSFFILLGIIILSNHFSPFRW